MHVYHIHKYIHTIYTHAEVIPGFQKEGAWGPLNGKKRGLSNETMGLSKHTFLLSLYLVCNRVKQNLLITRI